MSPNFQPEFGLEEIKEDLETISRFFNVNAYTLLNDIRSAINEYYNFDFEPDEDEYRYQVREDQHLEEELGIQDLFEGLREKNQ